MRVDAAHKVKYFPPSLLTGVRRYPPGHAYSGTLAGWAFSVTLRGSMVYQHPGGDIVENPGDALLIRPNVPHVWRVPEATQKVGWHGAWAVFFPRDRWLNWLQYPEIQAGYMRITLRKPRSLRRVYRSLKQADLLMNSPLHEREALSMSAVEQALLWCHEDQKGQANHLDPRVEKAIMFLTRNLGHSMTLDQLAEHCHSSRSRLSTVFGRQIGIPPMAFLERARMNRAMHLLISTEFQIGLIAHEVGYEDPKYFAKRFKEHTGKTPSAFRQRSKEVSADA